MLVDSKKKIKQDELLTIWECFCAEEQYSSHNILPNSGILSG